MRRRFVPLYPEKYAGQMLSDLYDWLQSECEAAQSEANAAQKARNEYKHSRMIGRAMAMTDAQIKMLELNNKG